MHTKNTHKKPCDLHPWPMTLKFNRLLEVVEVHVHAKFNQAECCGSWVIVSTNFLPYLAMVKNPKIRSSDVDLWPMTLKFNRLLEVVKVDVRAKFDQAKCNGSWIIALTERKLSDDVENITVVANPDSNNKNNTKIRKRISSGSKRLIS